MKKPNIIIIYADDLGYGDLGCYGSEYIKTPNLDAISEDGVRFTNWYSNSPVCSPSRAALLTGKHPLNAGMASLASSKRGETGLEQNQQTIAKKLRKRRISNWVVWKVAFGDK